MIGHLPEHVTEGGAADLLQELACTYLGPGIRFPPGGQPAHILTSDPDDIAGYAAENRLTDRRPACWIVACGQLVTCSTPP